MNLPKIRSNWIAGLVVVLLVSAAVAVPLIGREAGEGGILIHGRMAESGGWTPANLRARVGEPLHLRLTSDDVMHSFAIGQHPMEPVEVAPGEVSSVTLTFDRPGKYTFYCTRWCGVNHWRMRGVIEVSGPPAGPAVQEQTPAEPPPYVTLGLDIDRPHPASATPAAPPAPARGQGLLPAVPPEYKTQEYYRTHSPAEIWEGLRSEPGLKDLPDQELWDLTAALIQAQTSPEATAESRRLYAENCAACHGENGAGDGVMAEALARQALEAPDGEPGSGMPGMPMPGTAAGTPNEGAPSGHETTRPADFTDPASMLGASPAGLHGKIVRGGMGTGMPYWGPILTDEQIWALVAYIQSFQFEMEEQP